MYTQKRSYKLKALALFLAVFTILSTMPVAFAATALTVNNVTVWPTASGTIYCGQVLGEHITLSGGEVRYNGTVVEGTFAFAKPDSRPIGNPSVRASLIFTPKDETQYKGFTAIGRKEVTYTVLPVTPVLVDEANDKPRTEGTVETGTLLSAVPIVGGTLMNPNYPEKTNNLPKWTWSEPATVLTKSGLYEAKTVADKSFNSITCSVRVEVAEPAIPYATIIEQPEIKTFTYVPNMKWGDVSIVGGKADVPGKFELTDVWKQKKVSAGSFTLDAIFTPDDLTARQPKELQISAIVDKDRCRFVDTDGKEIIPELTLPYGTALIDGNVSALRNFAYPKNSTLNFVDPETGKKLSSFGTKPQVGTHEFEINIVSQDKNYAGGLRKIKLTVTPTVITPRLNGEVDKNTGECKYRIATDSVIDTPKGSFDVYLNGELYKSGIKYGVEFTFGVGDGNYDLKAVYRPAENDCYSIDDITASFSVKLPKRFTAIGADGANNADGTAFEAMMSEGSTVMVTAAVGAKPYYVFNGWEVVEGEVPEGTDLSKMDIKFDMPNCDITVQATWKFSLKLYLKNLFAPVATALSAFWLMLKNFFSNIIGK